MLKQDKFNLNKVNILHIQINNDKENENVSFCVFKYDLNKIYVIIRATSSFGDKITDLDFLP